MTATFDPELADPKDRIRQRIGDTDPASAQVQDETIEAYLLSGLSELGVARQLCLDLAAKWATASTVTLDDQQQRAEGVYKHYIDLAAQIGKLMAPPTGQGSVAGSIIVGGLNDTRGPLDDAVDGRVWPWLVSN
jgi:hypothetical protein